MSISPATLGFARPWPGIEAREQAEWAPHKVAVFCVGLFLPLIAPIPGERNPYTVFLDRIALVDVVVMLTMIWWFFLGRLRFPVRFQVYLLSVVIASFVGLSLGRTEEGHGVLIHVAAVLMAALYFVFACSMCQSPVLLRSFVIGVAAASAWEGFIVLHDYFAPTSQQWFQDPMSGRARGTFRLAGALGLYGLTSAGLLLVFGWPLFKSKRAQFFIAGCGALSLFMTVAGSRRSAMFAAAGGLALFLLLGVRHARNRAYLLVFGAVAAIVLAVLINFSTVKDSFLARRLEAAVEDVGSGETLAQNDFQATFENMHKWFPFGTGIGRGYQVGSTHHEMHDGHLMILAEMGLLGIFAFYFLMARCVFRRWEGVFGRHSRVVKTAAIAFVAAAAVGMIHNRLHRERAFMLFLGVMTSVSVAVVQRDPNRFSRRVLIRRPG